MTDHDRTAAPEFPGASLAGSSPAPLRLVLPLALLLFAVQTAILLLFRRLPPTPPITDALSDALLLSVVTFPLFYFMLFKPFVRQLTEHRRQEGRIREQNEFLENVIGSLPHPFYVIDVETYEIMTSNRPGMVGQPEGSRCFERSHGRTEPCTGELHPCPLAEVKRSGLPVVVEHLHHDPDGPPRRVEVHGYPIVDRSGRVVQIIESSIDVTERRRAEELLLEEKRLSMALVKYSAVPTFVIGPDHKVTNWNKACEELTKVKAAAVLGTDDHWRAFYPNPRPCLADLVISGDREDLNRFYKYWRQSSFIPHGLHAESWFPDLGGKRRYIMFEAAPIYDSHGRLVAAIQTILDITKRKELEEKFEQDASIDRLTGIYNRHKLEDLLAREIERSDRYGNPLSLIMIDIDHFKRINDTRGHDVGDAVLQAISGLLKGHLRKTDLLGRWGGEEFLIVATETAGGNAAVLAEKLRAALEVQRFKEEGLRASLSGGVAQYLPGETLQHLLKRVDEALYGAKRGGRNQVVAR